MVDELVMSTVAEMEMTWDSLFFDVSVAKKADVMD